MKILFSLDVIEGNKKWRRYYIHPYLKADTKNLSSLGNASVSEMIQQTLIQENEKDSENMYDFYFFMKFVDEMASKKKDEETGLNPLISMCNAIQTWARDDYKNRASYISTVVFYFTSQMMLEAAESIVSPVTFSEIWKYDKQPIFDKMRMGFITNRHEGEKTLKTKNGTMIYRSFRTLKVSGMLMFDVLVE